MRMFVTFAVIGWMVVGCHSKTQRELFYLVPESESGMIFSNELKPTARLNMYTFKNYFNGAGVAIGDLNNDDFPDVYLAGNEVANKLYLNKGNLRFIDVTDSAGLACSDSWSTGVTMADVNGDGWLDIFVCKSGPELGGIRHNQLFINNKNLTFTDRAVEYGVADVGLSIQAAFFDYDLDGDLDFYLLNNSNRPVGKYDLREGQRQEEDPNGGNRLYRNEGDHFVNITKQAGIYSSAIGFGLGVSVSDLNLDGWPDLFVSNDFFERDYLYLNNGNGTFSERLETSMNETSMGSMGADIADVNEDGFPDIFVTEMLPETLARNKTKISFESYDKFSESLEQGYYRQFNRNMLQVNLGVVDKGQIAFSEVGRLAGLEATEWSWGALIFDANQDGRNDVYVANGIAKDLLDQDYVHFRAPEIIATFNRAAKDSTLILDLLDAIPSKPVENALFLNQGFPLFHRVQHGQWNKPSFSNGAAYGDLDLDGDLDLVVNNINQNCFLLRNESTGRKENSFLTIHLVDTGTNTSAVGAKAVAYANGRAYHRELFPGRGYLSSVEPALHFGFEGVKKIDSIRISWPVAGSTKLLSVPANQRLKVERNQQTEPKRLAEKPIESILVPVENVWPHFANPVRSFVDFNREKLLLTSYSNQGTRLTQGDFNNDGRGDIFVGGSQGIAGAIWLGSEDGGYKTSPVQNHVFAEDSLAIDTDAACLDVNGDGWLDLVVTSGGNFYSSGASQLAPRLYLNDGRGILNKSELPRRGVELEAASFVRVIDFNNDQWPDLLLGKSFEPFHYEIPGGLRLLENDNGVLRDVTKEKANTLHDMGHVADAKVLDYDADGDQDIAVCGNWMRPVVLLNEGGRFSVSKSVNLGGAGMWNIMEVGDLNQDGRTDLVLGNAGLNTRFGPPRSKAFLVVGDLDGNNSTEHIYCVGTESALYPVVGYLDLAKQVPSIRKRYPSFEMYSRASMEDLFGSKALADARILMCETSSSVVVLNRGQGQPELIDLPLEAQISTVNAILLTELNNDGIPDLIVGGNESIIKPEFGPQLASFSLALIGVGNGQFKPLRPSESGILVRGEVRDIERIVNKHERIIVFWRNGTPPQAYRLSETKKTNVP